MESCWMMDVMVATSTSGKRDRREGGDVPAAMFPVNGPTKDGGADVARSTTGGAVGAEVVATVPWFK